MKETTGVNFPRQVLGWTETAGLGLVFLATVISIGLEVWHMIEVRNVALGDLLLLFIFLEVISMIGIYYQSHRVPVRYPIYIAITALARTIVLDSKSLEPWALVAIGSTVLLLAGSVLVIRFGHVKYPFREEDS